MGASFVTGVFLIKRRASTAFHSDLDTGFRVMADLERVETGIWGLYLLSCEPHV